jgi:GWxTD domain-containing protein
MKVYALYIFILLLGFSSVYAQTEDAGMLSNHDRAPKFYQDLLDFSSAKKNTTRLDVFIQVPYSSIQFVRGDNGFIGKYSVTVSVFDSNKDKLISEKIWNEKVVVKGYNETVSKERYSLNVKSFYLQPDEYFIRSSISDEESSNESPIETMFKVRNLSSNFAVSDVMLISKRTEEAGKSRIIPNVSGNVATQKDGLPLFFEIYSDTARKLEIEYKVLDKKKDQIYNETENKDVDSGRTQIFSTIRDSSFSLGYYKLEVKIKDVKDNKVVSVEKPFFSRWLGIPASVTDLGKAIDQLIYIASTDEIDHIKDAKTNEEKLKRYMAFWKKLDPTPETEQNEVFDEYYGRIAYANAHFSHYIEGWKTDRGMVFILLGPPDNVDRHPFDLDAKPYEVWEYYNLNRSLVFVDYTGFGDYRLTTPLTGDLYKFRR